MANKVNIYKVTDTFLLHLVDVVSNFTAEENMYFSTEVRKELIEKAKETFNSPTTINRSELSKRERMLIKAYASDLMYNGCIITDKVINTSIDPRTWNPKSIAKRHVEKVRFFAERYGKEGKLSDIIDKESNSNINSAHSFTEGSDIC